jgi:hypothetical protein
VRESDEGSGLDQDEAIARVHAARAVSSHGARPRRRTMLRALARPEGVGRALATYEIPIEGRDEWLAAARRLA